MSVSIRQVHVRTRPCFGRTNTVTCNCAVVFRENNNVLGVFACQRGEPPVSVRYLVDQLSPADDITVSSGGTRYTVRLLQPRSSPRRGESSLTHNLTNVTLYNTISHRSQISRLQQIQNSLARAVVKAPTFSHTIAILRSYHWHKLTEHVEYKLLSLTCNIYLQPRNIPIRTVSSLSSLLATFALYLWSLSVVLTENGGLRNGKVAGVDIGLT